MLQSFLFYFCFFGHGLVKQPQSIKGFEKKLQQNTFTYFLIVLTTIQICSDSLSNVKQGCRKRVAINFLTKPVFMLLNCLLIFHIIDI